MYLWRGMFCAIEPRALLTLLYTAPNSCRFSYVASETSIGMNLGSR